MAFCRMQRTLPCQACARQLNGHCKQRHNWWDGARRDQCQKPWSGAVVVGHRIATRSTRLGSSKPQGCFVCLEGYLAMAKRLSVSSKVFNFCQGFHSKGTLGRRGNEAKHGLAPGLFLNACPCCRGISATRESVMPALW